MAALGARPDNFAVDVGRVIGADVAGATAAVGDFGGCRSGACHCVCRAGKFVREWCACFSFSSEVRGVYLLKLTCKSDCVVERRVSGKDSDLEIPKSWKPDADVDAHGLYVEVAQQPSQPNRKAQ